MYECINIAIERGGGIEGLEENIDILGVKLENI